MKFSLVLATLFSVLSLQAATDAAVPVVKTETVPQKVEVVTVPNNSTINVSYPACPEHKATAKAEMKPTMEKASVESVTPEEDVLAADEKMLISVVGQGVAPMNTSSPAQAYALAKRAAVADAYRLVAEKVKGVRIDGQDLIKNMMVKRSTVRTSVAAMVRNANIVETTFKEGLCEVEMEIVISHAQFK